MLEAIKKWRARYPDHSDSDVIRVALVEGLRALAKDPTPLEPQRVDISEISPSSKDLTDESRAELAKIRSERKKP